MVDNHAGEQPKGEHGDRLGGGPLSLDRPDGTGTQADRDKKQDERARRREILTFWVAVAGMVIAGFGVAVSYMQWQIMQAEARKAASAEAAQNVAIERALVAFEKQASALTNSIGPATTSAAQAAETSANATKKLANAAKLSAESSARSAALSASQLERTDRPVITVDLASAGPVTATDAGMDFQVQIALTNGGRSEASNVHVNAEITYGNRELVTKELAITCQMADMFLRSDLGGSSIRAGGRHTHRYRQLLNIETIREHQFTLNGIAGYFFNPVIVGCVAYTIPYSDRPHHSPFAYNIYQRPRTPTDVWAVYRVGDSVPAEAVFFSQETLTKHKPD